MMSRVPDQRAADLLESDRTKRPAHLLLWNRTVWLRQRVGDIRGASDQHDSSSAVPRLAIHRRYAVRNRTAAPGAGAPLMTTCDKTA